MARKKNMVEYVEGDNHRKKFMELLERATKNKSKQAVFNDFLQIAAITFSSVGNFVIDSRIAKERSERYIRVISDYDTEVQVVFGGMLYELTEELQTYCQGNYTDVLGDIFHELNLKMNVSVSFLLLKM